MNSESITNNNLDQKTQAPRLNNKSYNLFLFLIIFVLFIAVSVLAFQNHKLSKKLINQQEKPTQIDESQNSGQYGDWVVFQSTRVPFSFKHPADYKLGVHFNGHVYQFENRVEAINLGTFDAAPNAGGPSKGYIIVEKYGITDGISEEDRILTTYRDSYKYFKEQKLKQGETNIPTEEEYLPKLTVTKIGNAEAYKLTTNKYSQGTFSPTLTQYYVYRRGLLYIIGITTSDDMEVKMIEDILQTFDFQY